MATKDSGGRFERLRDTPSGPTNSELPGDWKGGDPHYNTAGNKIQRKFLNHDRNLRIKFTVENPTLMLERVTWGATSDVREEILLGPIPCPDDEEALAVAKAIMHSVEREGTGELIPR